MDLKNLYSQAKPVISFEVFPPKNDETGEKLEKLFCHLKILKEKNPAFISLTYGAGGTGQNLSLEIFKRIINDLNIPVMPHFTCISSNKKFVEEYLNVINSLGIKNILALRGDIPENVDVTNLEFRYASELVEFIKEKSNLSIAVAGYPEGHNESTSIDVDMQKLKLKVDKGADVIFTQMFFDNTKYYNFVERAQKIGINIPIIPGILPVKSFSQLEKMLSMAKITVPKPFMEKLEKYKDDKDEIKKIGLDFAISQCQDLVNSNVKGLHFYTLNTSYMLKPILDELNF